MDLKLISGLKQFISQLVFATYAKIFSMYIFKISISM